MSDFLDQLFSLPRPNLKHLFLSADARRIDYRGPRNGPGRLRDVERKVHAEMLNLQLAEVAGKATQYIEAIRHQDMPEFEGIVLKVESEPGFPLSAGQVEALTTKTGEADEGKITLLNATKLCNPEGQEYSRVVLNVPFGCLSYLQEKIRIYSEGEGTTQQAFLGNITRIAEAAIDFLWTDKDEDLPRGDEDAWWQFWVLKKPESAQHRFTELAQAMGIEIRGKALILPERYVYVAKTKYSLLVSSPALLDTLGEIRGAYPLHHDFMDLSAAEQREYVEEAETRIRLPGLDAPRVCILDTGVNRSHRLLAGLINEVDTGTVYGDETGGDAYTANNSHGHGTPMAGMAAFGDLRELLSSTNQWDQHHRLESVRIFDPTRPHDPDNYGAVTEQAIAIPEIKQNASNRVYCLAITAPGQDDGRPSAWSSAVDAAAFGAEAANAPKRLFVISTGNLDPVKVPDYSYPDDNRYARIEDPAQAWNAITVGALTHRISVTEPDDESRRLSGIAAYGGVSPFSRSSFDWDDHWPIKPEIVLEGGNAARHPEHGVEMRESLELVSTSAMTGMGRELCSFNATSAATAQAARMLAETYHRYPDIWPETARGLLVHSARWNETMLRGIDPHSRYSRAQRQRLKEMLRVYGYGEPNITRCNYSARHAVTMIREDSLQPYSRRNGSIQLNDCHIHIIPLPKELLQQHPTTTITLRVTLSYFTAPNPSANNALGSSRYRYGGTLLRYMVRHKEDSEAEFNARIERTAESNENNDPEEDDTEIDSPARRRRLEPGWALGTQLRGKSGSLLHDVWRGPAADLLTMDRIAVFPRKGWWANGNFPEGDPWHNAHQLPQRYSLLVSIEADQDIPIYNEIQGIIETPVSVDAT